MLESSPTVRPNLFKFATSELSQDAFICWLLEWARSDRRSLNAPLHETALELAKELVRRGGRTPPNEIHTLVVQKQTEQVDLLAEVNEDLVILVEDKVHSTEHSDQLERYRAAMKSRYPQRSVVPVYFKTGNSSNVHAAEKAGYAPFQRRDLLRVLDRGLERGVRSDIFVDFTEHLHALEALTSSFARLPLTEWKREVARWQGFFSAIQDRLGEGDWAYQNNPAGGFLSFEWRWTGDQRAPSGARYLQLAEHQVCFKIGVQDPPSRQRARDEWRAAVLEEGRLAALPIRRGGGRLADWMTVAVLEGDYRVADAEGRLDFEATIAGLRKIEEVFDRALNRIARES